MVRYFFVFFSKSIVFLCLLFFRDPFLFAGTANVHQSVHEVPLFKTMRSLAHATDTFVSPLASLAFLVAARRADDEVVEPVGDRSGKSVSADFDHKVVLAKHARVGSLDVQDERFEHSGGNLAGALQVFTQVFGQSPDDVVLSYEHVVEIMQHLRELGQVAVASLEEVVDVAVRLVDDVFQFFAGRHPFQDVHMSEFEFSCLHVGFERHSCVCTCVVVFGFLVFLKCVLYRLVLSKKIIHKISKNN